MEKGWDGGIIRAAAPIRKKWRENDKSPIFTIKTESMNDGGTKIYYGIGYQFIDWKIIDGDEFTGIQYKVGKEIHIFNFIDPLSEGPNVSLEIMTE